MFYCFNNCYCSIAFSNSIASPFIQNNSGVFLRGPPCNLTHTSASHSNDGFTETNGETLDLNVENAPSTCYTVLKKSSQRNGKMKEYFDCCNQEYQGVLKHLSVC